VLLLAGTNDLLAYPPVDVAAIADALARIAEQHATLVLTVPRMLAAERRAPALTERRRALNALIRARFRFVDVAAAFEEDAAEKFFDADGLHLTKSGYGKVAKLVLPACKEAAAAAAAKGKRR